MSTGLRWLVGILAVVFCGAVRGDALGQIRLFLDTNVVECVAGVPIVAEIRVQNVSDEVYEIQGSPAWGNYLGILYAQGTDVFRELPPDLPHGDTEEGPQFFTVYRLDGELGPRESQILVYVLRAEKFEVGTVRLKAQMFQREGMIETSEVEVRIVAQSGDRPDDVLSEDDMAVIHENLRFHNHIGFAGGWRNGRIVPIVRKVLDIKGSKLAYEYGLYLGVLNGMSMASSRADSELGLESANALLKKYPKSCFRAHAYAAVAEIQKREGRPQEARTAINNGLALPESRPLYDNLKLNPESLE